MKAYFATRRRAPRRRTGVTAAMHGEADDAPDLALIGILVIVGALAVAVRVAQRRGV